MLLLVNRRRELPNPREIDKSNVYLCAAHLVL